MNLLHPEDVAAALSWLTTWAFRQAEFPVLAVVLAGQEHTKLLQHLEEECRQIDRESDQLLILSLASEGPERPLEIFNPSWKSFFKDDLALRIESIQARLRGGGHHGGTCWGTFPEAALKLLDLEPACLPAVYIRSIEAQGADDRHSRAVVVPLPHARPELASRFLKQLSWAASDQALGVETLSAFLSKNELFGWVISKPTQDAIDNALPPTAGFSRHPPTGLHRVCGPEEERVAMVYESAVAYPLHFSYHRSELLSAAEGLFAAPTPSPTGFKRPDLAIGLKVAATAEEMGDYATTVRNIAATMEAVFNSSALHLIRGFNNIKLPTHLDHVDPEAGPVSFRGVLLNHPRKEAIGMFGGLHPWLAPPLGAGVQIFEQWFTEFTPPNADRSACARISHLLSEIAMLRNPVAHGERTHPDAARNAWKIFETFLTSGCALAMISIRSNFKAWPEIQWDSFNRIGGNLAPSYERALANHKSSSKNYDSISKTEEKKINSLRREIEHIKTAIDYILKFLENPHINLNSIITFANYLKREFYNLTSSLRNWEELQKNLMLENESDRLAKNLSRAAARWFQPRRREDSHLLAEFSRALTPTVKIFGDPDPINTTIERLEILLSSGKIIPRHEDWRTTVKDAFSGWLFSVPRSKAAQLWLNSICHTDGSVSDQEVAPIVLTMRGWIEDLQVSEQKLEELVVISQASKETAYSILSCARELLSAARIGRNCCCSCGNHLTP